MNTNNLLLIDDKTLSLAKNKVEIQKDNAYCCSSHNQLLTLVLFT